MKVLLSAYACAPGCGSEPAVGWNWVLQIARFHEVWVVALGEQQPAIERALSSHPLPNAHFVYLDLPRWRKIRRLGWLGGHIFHYAWQIAAYFVGRKLHRRESFDLVHHVTFGCYWRPSFLALLPPPFIWGPVGGGESAPRVFWPSFSLRGKIFELARDLGRKMGECDPFVRHAARKATLGLAATEQTAARLRRLGVRHVIVHPQFAMTREQGRPFRLLPIRRQSPFRLISIGRLLPWKGFHLGLRAFAKLQAIYPYCEYWIINNGLEMNHLKALARKLGVENKVTFWGTLPTLQEVYSKLAECDVLVHPALHEAFGNVCLEAMASGRPVICLDLGGPALQVTEETGIKVPACTPDQVVADLAAAMLRLATDPILRIGMGHASQRRVEEHFDWDRKGEFLARVYADIVREGRALAC
ncbi:MAG: glycosyltransferase [Terriglobia bacterium]|jgi:glycosyltransferase involved in cell wall biosynthesis